jgi:hypothetical protein
MSVLSAPSSQYMYWQGRYFDTSLIYQYTPERSVTLRVVGHASAKPVDVGSSIEFGRQVNYRSSTARRLTCSIEHDGQHKEKRTWEQHGAEDYLEISFEHPRYVTHIGTAGKRKILAGER